MKAYMEAVDHQGLRWFFPEDVIPRDLLQHDVWRQLTQSTTAVWALVADDEAAEAIRADLISGHHRHPCTLLLNRAVELLSLLSVLPDLSGTATTRVGASRWPSRGINPQAGASD